MGKPSEKRLTGSRNHCQGCREYFNSFKAFDRHRTGEHGVNRRCRTPEEMLARGMLLNKDGFWITEAREIHEDQVVENES